MYRSTRVAVALLLLSAVLGVGAISAIPAEAAPDPSQVGSWGAQIPLGLIGVHATLLSNGDVLYYELPGSTLNGATLFDPQSGTTTRVDPQLNWSVFCSGMNLMPDGRLFATGGEPPRSQFPVGTGVKNAAFFNPATNAWTGAASMRFARWYPSGVQMPDRSVLVFGGEKAPTGTDKLIPTVERYAPATNTWSNLPSSADTKGLYPRVVLLPSGRILKVGPQPPTRSFNPATYAWTTLDRLQFAPRQAGSFVLLPGLDVAMTSGGKNANGVVTPTTEVIDVTAADPEWSYTGPMQTARMHHNLVLLPDGTVLAVGGGQQGKFGLPVKTAELFDPSTGRWTEVAAQAGQRTYHSTAILLPDGRVISAGSNSGRPEQTTAEIYSPPYLFKGARPAISSAPASVSYGSSFDISTPTPTGINRVALIKLGTNTHGLNFDQRYVEVPFTVSGGLLRATAPPDAATAPRGTYMLFLVNGSGVPSVASMIQVG